MSTQGTTLSRPELDEIRARVSLRELVGRKVKLSRSGKEWKGLCPFHAETTPSFTIYDRDGRYHCFGCGADGDAFEFVAKTEQVPFQAAIEKLRRHAGMPGASNGNGKAVADWFPMVPPASAARPDAVLEAFDLVYEYTDASDRVTHFVGRIDARGTRRKQFVPITYGRLGTTTGWHKRAPASPRPLYGLNRLATMPAASVILCEGEKAADAAQQLFPDRACVSWMGGAGQVEHADVAPLLQRNVIIWPDADEQGHGAAAKLQKMLPRAQLLRVDDLPDGDDAADLAPDDPEAWLHDHLPGGPIDALGIWNAGLDDYEQIPPRGWLLGSAFCRKFLSSLIADGGVGKTALRIAQLISAAIGRSLTGDHVFRRCRVLIVSLEDDRDELRRRVYAVLRHHGIAPAELEGQLFLAAPKGLKLAEMRDGRPQAAALEKLIRDAVAAHKIDIVSLDPFVKTHSVDENGNNAIDFVCGLLGEIAIDHDCAADLPHHTNKGAAIPGDANRGRGATAMKDAARLVYTLTPMSSDEAAQFGLSEAERRSLVRLDSAKVNIAPPSATARWFRLIGVPLGNGNADYPNGDEVQTVEPWTPPDTWAGLDASLLNRILSEIDAGMKNGQRYSSAPSATTRAAWRVVENHAREKSEKQCRDVIKAWVKNGTLTTDEYDDPVDRKTRSGLQVDHAKRPS